MGKFEHITVKLASLARISHNLAQRGGRDAGLTRFIKTKAPAVVLVQYVEEADGA